MSHICKDGFGFLGAEIAVSELIHHRLSNLQNESAAFFSLTVKALVTLILPRVGVSRLKEGGRKVLECRLSW